MTHARAFVAVCAAVVAGAAAALLGSPAVADLAWGLVTGVVAAGLAVSIGRDLMRREPGVDLIALLAMAGALALGEVLAGAVIAVMLTGGRALESLAAGRATRELTSLLERAPRTAHRLVDERLETVDVGAVDPGDVLLVRTGEAVPVDGLLAERAVLDEAALTGESRPVERGPHERVSSGAVNAGSPLRLRAVATAADSTFEGIVRLVESAAADKAPFSRLADRYALVFVPVALVVSTGAWLISGDPVRGLAVLVVATPCPLILAAPIALVAGVSRAARRGIIVKGAAALERLAAATTVVFDKTGTMTAGAPQVREVVTLDRWTGAEVLRWAGALEQASAHVYATAIVHAALAVTDDLPLPADVVEHPGTGVLGRVDGRSVRLGSPAWVLGDPPDSDAARGAMQRADVEGVSAIAVAVDDRPAGVLLLDDPIRPEAARAVRSLREGGVQHTVMLTGDHPAIAGVVAAALGVDEVLADQSPEDKIAAVRRLASRDGPVVMVGDGINDAPALAGADVGVAMGARGATASSQAADIVVTVDRLDRLAEARMVAARSKRIAVQSVLLGMGLSLVAMGFAAAGFIPPVAGAALQEAIDLAAILNALRALRSQGRVPIPTGDRALGVRFRAEHRALAPGVDRIRDVADRLEQLPPAVATAELASVRAFLLDELLPHERDEEEHLFPRLAVLTDGAAADPLSGAHREIERLTHLLDRLLALVPSSGPRAEDSRELRRLLYGLHAILRFHFAQEDEWYAALDDTEMITV